MIKRKSLVQEKPIKSQPNILTKKVKKSLKIDALPDAIVDGKFVGQIGTELITLRYRDGKEKSALVTVKQIDTDGLVHSWDETLHQWFLFSLKEPPKVLKISQ